MDKSDLINSLLPAMSDKVKVFNVLNKAFTVASIRRAVVLHDFTTQSKVLDTPVFVEKAAAKYGVSGATIYRYLRCRNGKMA